VAVIDIAVLLSAVSGSWNSTTDNDDYRESSGLLSCE